MASPPRRDIEFKTFDGLTLRGWFYPAAGNLAKSPAIVISHGVRIPCSYIRKAQNWPNASMIVVLRERNAS